VASFVLEMTIGFISRMQPQINTMVVTAPLKILVGLVILGASMAFVPLAVRSLMDTIVLRKLSMAQQAGERTEKATSRRRQRARDQGQFAYSQELTSAMTLAACVVTAFYGLRSPAGFRAFFAGLLENAETQSASELVRQAGTYFLIVAAPI